MWGSTARVRRPCRPPTSPGTSTSSRWGIIVQNKSDDRGHLSTFFRSGFWGASLYFPRSKHNCRRRRGEYLNHGQRVWLYLITTQTPRAGWGAAKQYFLFQLEQNKPVREFYIQELNHSSPARSVLWNHVAQNSFLIRVVYQMLHTATLGLSHKMIASNYRGGEVNENQTSHFFLFPFFWSVHVVPPR